jgi:DNA-binding transcriptional LysR family regulator
MIGRFYPEANIVHQVDSLIAMNAVVRDGLGASVLPCYWADRDDRLRRIYPEPVEDSDLGLWILAHPDVRRAARVRAFTDFATAAFLADRDLFIGVRAG